MTNEPTSGNAKVDIMYRKKRNALEMKHQIITFSLMMFLTLVAFLAVAYPNTFPKMFSVPFILLLAIVQVIFQLYYFMHMSHKGHEAPTLFLYSGLLVGIITILTFVTIVWI